MSLHAASLAGATSVFRPPQRVATRHRAVRATVCGSFTVTLVLPGGKQASFKADNSHSIYEWATAAGVSLPACCMQGSCTSCVAKVVKGKVDDHDQCCLSAPIHAQGYVALCCAVPLSDVTLETHQGPTVRKLKRELSEANY